MRVLLWILLGMGALVIGLTLIVYLSTFHPADIQEESVVCPGDAQELQSGQSVKVLSWNVQYMASKNYIFFYDLIDGSGPDERPSRDDIDKTTREVARIINEENPDIILLQEVDDGSKRTDYEDQLANLLPLISNDYRCHTTAWYWKAAFVPHPHIMGSVGMKLVIISRYKISKSIRYQLELIPGNPLMQQLNLKRAVLAAHFPVSGARPLVAMDTHLDAFAQGTDTMEKQVEQVKEILKKHTDEGFPWLIGGDFNLLPPGNSYEKLEEHRKPYYKEQTEIKPLFDLYQAVPSYEDANGEDVAKWYTHFANEPKATGPDRIIDYIFLSKNIDIGSHYVRQEDTLHISDHLPVLVNLKVP